jgi:hypothetical protein
MPYIPRLRTWVFRTYPGPSTGDTRTQGFWVGWLPRITRVFGWHPGASARDFGGGYSAPRANQKARFLAY